MKFDPAKAAAQINAEHENAERAIRSGIEHAIRAGELLVQAKRHVAHGGWLDWVKENVSFSERLAQAYMRLARLPIEKRNAVADLPLREALSPIQCRERRLADLAAFRERAASPPTPMIDNGDEPEAEATVGDDEPRAEVIASDDDLKADVTFVPLTPEEIADELMERLAWEFNELSGQITVDDLCAAFERKFGVFIEIGKSPREMTLDAAQPRKKYECH
jgi:hypothetical protein